MAQSTLNVAKSYWKRPRSRTNCGGRLASPTSDRYSAGAPTSASTPRGASIVVPSPSSTATARRSRTTTRVTGDEHCSRPPPRLEATDQRGGELRRHHLRARGTRTADPRLREHPAEEPARWCVGAHVAVQRVAGEQQRAALAGERVARELAYREQRLPREVEQPARSERGREAGGAADRWHRRRHRVEQRVADALELAVQPAPRVTVARGELLERRRGLVELGRQHRAPPVGGGCASASGAQRHRSPYDSSSRARMTGDATPSG